MPSDGLRHCTGDRYSSNTIGILASGPRFDRNGCSAFHGDGSTRLGHNGGPGFGRHNTGWGRLGCTDGGCRLEIYRGLRNKLGRSRE